MMRRISIHKPQVIIADLSGTLCEKNGWYLTRMMHNLLKSYGINNITENELRSDMGIAKECHFRKTIRLSSQKYGSSLVFDDEKLPIILSTQLNKQISSEQPTHLKHLSSVIDGVPEAIQLLRRRFPNVLIGATTGYDFTTAEKIIKEFAKQNVVLDGFATPDCCFPPEGRPSAKMIQGLIKRWDSQYKYRNLWERFYTGRLSGWKFGDTPNDAKEAKNAGFQSFSIVETSALCSAGTMGTRNKNFNLDKFKKRFADTSTNFLPTFSCESLEKYVFSMIDKK